MSIILSLKEDEYEVVVIVIDRLNLKELGFKL